MTAKGSIIIRCYNEERHIGRLLEGILCQTIQDVEIIAVDSGSTDGTLNILASYPVKVLTIRPEDFSFGRSLNMGCEEACGEFIVAASAHVYPVTRIWLEQLLAPFDDPRVALSYGKQIGNEITKYSEHQVFAKWFPDQSNFNQDYPFCNNANAAVRRHVWEQIRYDEQLTGLEDIDWAQRAMSLGYKIAYTADAAIVHVHDEAWANICNRYRREAIALKRIYPQEQFHLWDFVRLFVGNAVSDCYHSWKDGVLRRNIKSNLMFRAMQFWGTYRGFNSRGAVTSKLKRRLYYPLDKRCSHSLSKPVTVLSEIDYHGGPSEYCRSSNIGVVPPVVS
jgi:rhamnosyltransferase